MVGSDPLCGQRGSYRTFACGRREGLVACARAPTIPDSGGQRGDGPDGGRRSRPRRRARRRAARRRRTRRRARAGTRRRTGPATTGGRRRRSRRAASGTPSRSRRPSRPRRAPTARSRSWRRSSDGGGLGEHPADDERLAADAVRQPAGDELPEAPHGRVEGREDADATDGEPGVGEEEREQAPGETVVEVVDEARPG